MNKKAKKILSKYYSKEFYLSPKYASFKEYRKFVKDGVLSKLFLKALDYVPKGTNGPFLDIGSGKGELVLYLARNGKRAFGIDYSKDAYEIATKNLSRENKKVKALTSYKILDITNLPYKNNFFECIFLLDVVEHLTPKQLKLTLKEIKRVLKTDGTVIIHTNNKYFEKLSKLLIAVPYHGISVFLHPKMYLEQTSFNPYEFMHVNYLTGKQMSEFLTSTGFKSKIEFVKPLNKRELNIYLPFKELWKKIIYHNLAWIVLNTPLTKFLSPTFWVVARKRI
ncbi:class I SAM-dependent methyltransferase [Candidatus Woesebacteria bacterium]|nr:class I SAM-dependent methyltransferase [Candidatus Woesebacteria bacterium]